MRNILYRYIEISSEIPVEKYIREKQKIHESPLLIALLSGRKNEYHTI